MNRFGPIQDGFRAPAPKWSEVGRFGPILDGFRAPAQKWYKKTCPSLSCAPCKSACIADRLEQKTTVARLHGFACRNEARRRRYPIILLYTTTHTHTHSEALHHFALTLPLRVNRSGRQSSSIKPTRKTETSIEKESDKIPHSYHYVAAYPKIERCQSVHLASSRPRHLLAE